MKKILVCVFPLVLLFGCTDGGSPRGDVNVEVVYNSQPVENARVYTNPETVEATTDQFGSCLLENIEAGSIEFFAERTGIGVGKTIKYVNAGRQTDVKIVLVNK